MQENSCAELATQAPAWPRATLLAMLLLNAAPLCHLVFVIAAAAWVHGFQAKLFVGVAGIYLLPPLVVRLLLHLHPLTGGTYSISSRSFLVWWASAQGQMLFCRLPFLEELLRFVPGLYSAWLRLWGSKIGRLTYWSPGLQVLDRSFLEIGNNVVFGAGVRLNPHVIAEDERGISMLQLAPIQVGRNCQIGGYALLTAGTRIVPGENLKAFSLSPPFTVWEKGRRAKPATPR